MIRAATRTHHGIYAVIEKEGKILLIIKKRGPYTGRYDLPGGSPENNETETQTLFREIKEETGCLLTEYKNRREITVGFDGFVEDDNRAGYLIHTGILFDCRIEGIPDETIADLDSDGALWVDKNKLNKDNATPLVLVGAGLTTS